MTTRLRPARITLARILFLLGGTISVINGAIELGPDARPEDQATGWPLIIAGVGALIMVVLLRRPRPWLPAAAAVSGGLMIAVRIAQTIVIESPALLVTCILPAFAAWSLLRPAGRAWASTTTSDWTARVAAVRRERARHGAVRRTLAGVGAVGLVAVALVSVTGAGVGAALAPCNLPATAATSGLVTESGPASAHKPTGSIRATDGTRLAYTAFVPANPVASLLFYHGSGANAAAGYLPIGRTLQQQGIAVYLFDIRGHGASGGPRGDTPSTPQLEQDTAAAFAYVRDQQPDVPAFIGGHSAGAGVVLNSAHLLGSAPAGYVFLAPDFGLHSGTERQDDASNFATICQRPLIAATVTNGLLGAHTDAVAFAYTAEQVRSGLVPHYTAAMAIAQNADDSAAVLAGLHAPVGVWIGADDEVFDPSAVTRFAHGHGGSNVTADVVPQATHLGILSDSAPMGHWILEHTKQR